MIRLIYIIFSILILVSINFYIFPSIRNSRDYNDEQVENFSFDNFEFYSQDGKSLNIDNKKIIVLDIWATSCSYCIEQFPDFEEFYNTLRNEENVKIYSLNIPILKETVQSNIEFSKKFEYDFPFTFTSNDSISKYLGFNTYPRLVIIQNGMVIYNGSPHYNKLESYNSYQFVKELLNK